MEKLISNLLIFLLLISVSCKDPCLSVGCLNGGVCNNGACICPDGFSGENCEEKGPCVGISCLNGGICNDGVCLCPNGFSGEQCEIADSCLVINCLNGGNCIEGTCICPDGFSGENCEIVDPVILLPSIACGANWTLDCLSNDWSIFEPAVAKAEILENCFSNQSCLLLTNLHDPLEPNPDPILLNTIISNIKNGQSYRIRCSAKIKGYPDEVTGIGFSYYAYTTNNWYGEFTRSSEGGVYFEKDWTTYSYNFISGTEVTLDFQFYSIYDSVWVKDLIIEEL